jgi:GntR family transcriptional repressor for pyruvate dehydrogenase complex
MLAPIGLRDRVDEVQQRLAEAIEMGAFGDGEQLPSEAALAAQLTVAPSTLREALVGLREDGFVETRRGRHGGSFVRNGTRERRARLVARLREAGPDRLRDVGDMHAAVSAAAAGRAAERGTVADYERLTLRAEVFAEAATPTAGLLADRRFHQEMASVSGSQALTRSESRLQAEVGALTWLLFDPEGIATAAEEHRAILSAVVAGDCELAARLMREHVEGATRELVDRRMLRFPRRRNGRSEGSTEEYMGEVMHVVQAIADQVLAALSRAREAAHSVLIAVPPGRSPTREDLAPFDRQIALEFVRQPRLAGMGLALEPSAAGPSWVWWQATVDGPVPLLVNLDEGSAELYDYAHAEWFARPRASNRAWLAGPYVDFGGADDHILTFALPMVLEAGSEPVGVVGADVTVRQIEDSTAAALAALDRPAALVNRHGVVIATNSGAALPGTKWSSPSGEERRLRDDGLGLSVVCAA